MGFFDNIVKQIFGEKGDNNQPVLHEELKRKKYEQNSYNSWLKHQKERPLLDFLCEQYELNKEGRGDQTMVRILYGSSSKGFLFRYPANIGAIDFQHLIDLLRDRFLENGYKLYASDRKMYNRPKHVEAIERHYLKPRIKPLDKLQGEHLDQLFGNVFIELYKIDDKPTHIKLLCNHYADANYGPPLNMQEMMDLICG